MKHSVDELVAIAHQFFPKGMLDSDPRYSETPEVQRQLAARIPASARYEDWRALLSRLRARFPARDFPGVEVQNLSLFLQLPTAASSPVARGRLASRRAPKRSTEGTQRLQAAWRRVTIPRTISARALMARHHPPDKLCTGLGDASTAGEQALRTPW